MLRPDTIHRDGRVALAVQGNHAGRLRSNRGAQGMTCSVQQIRSVSAHMGRWKGKTTSRHVRRDTNTVIHGAKAAGLVLALIFSACLMTAATRSGELSFLGWLALLPLFYAIRTCSPTHAMLCGAVWGGCLGVLIATTTDGAAENSIFWFAVVAAVPALYAYLCARLTRWVGFDPFVLAVGWMGVELCFAPLGLRQGLLAATQNDGTFWAWMGHGLGYVLVAFIVAVVNASLVSVLSAVRLEIPRPTHQVPSSDLGASLLPQMFFCYPLFALRPSQPRAPPTPRQRKERATSAAKTRRIYPELLRM